jgi:hypothetical protein
MGYSVTDGYADTGDWMGWVYVNEAPWIFNDSIQGWMYVDAAGSNEMGSWVYLP